MKTTTSRACAVGAAPATIATESDLRQYNGVNEIDLDDDAGLVTEIESSEASQS